MGKPSKPQVLIALPVKSGKTDRLFLKRLARKMSRLSGENVTMGECVVLGARLLEKQCEKVAKEIR